MENEGTDIIFTRIPNISRYQTEVSGRFLLFAC